MGLFSSLLNRDEVDLLCGYDWSGNVRELEHIMENVAIISNGATPNLRELRKYFPQKIDVPENSEIFSLDDVIGNHIRTALSRTNGRIGGDKGAAALLGLNAKTLESKMRKLGIQRKVSFS